MTKLSTLLTVIAITILCFVAKAQTTVTGKISGKVGDANHALINAATISLLHAKDSSVIKMSVIDKDGLFEFENLQQGNYLLLATAVGYGKAYSAPISLAAGNSVSVEPLTLTPVSKDLKAVTVTARKPLIEMKMDRTVVNVEAAVTNVGANALEVLEKSPGVQVDKDGNISLKGKQGVTILIDGRPSYLSGADLAAMLKGMQASQLDQIEIMTNPPAKYDAAGNSGIINIKTKKNKVKGFNGNVSAGVGLRYHYVTTNESVSLNYRNGKVNLFGNYSYGHGENLQELDIHRLYKNPDGSANAIFQQVSNMNHSNDNNNLKLGMDYYVSKKTTLGIVLSGFANPDKQVGDNISYLENPGGAVDSIVSANSLIKELWKNGSVNLNMRHEYDSTGRELDIDIDYIKYKASNVQYFDNITLTPAWAKKYDEQLSGDLPTNIDIYSAKADYTLPLKKQLKLEMGVKSSYVVTDSKANYYNLEGSDWQPDYDKTNFFRYRENINAAYVSLNKQLNKKWGVQAGLRFENTNYDGLDYGNPTKPDSAFKHSYASAFPTAYVSYNASKNNQFGVSFGRRIDRPRYQDLNPFLFFLDKYTYGSGNPYLKPQYSNNFELSHIFKGWLNTTINYSVTKDLVTETFDQSGYATIVRQGNIGHRENAGIAVSAQIPVTKWWTSILYSNYNYTWYSGTLYGDPLKISAGMMFANINNQFNFKKGWSAELSGWYRTKGLEGQILLQPMGQVSGGVSKQVMKGKGSVRFNMRDIFNTQNAHGNINFKETEASFVNKRFGRSANITFTYRFGKPLKSTAKQHRNGGAGDEQNRVNTGG